MCMGKMLPEMLGKARKVDPLPLLRGVKIKCFLDILRSPQTAFSQSQYIYFKIGSFPYLIVFLAVL